MDNIYALLCNIYLYLNIYSGQMLLLKKKQLENFVPKFVTLLLFSI